MTHGMDGESDGESDLEERAARLFRRIPMYQTTTRMARRPFFVEFAGGPKAGKTTTLERLDKLLRRSGFRVRVISELASTSPLRAKLHVYFNLWTMTKAISQILESMERAEHIVLIDRGLFDALCWMDWHLSAGRMTTADYNIIANFLRLHGLRRLTDMVFVLTTEPEAALDREVSGQLTRRPGGIMNPTTLLDINQSIHRARQRYASDFTFVDIDTTDPDPRPTLNRMANITFDALEQFLESILVLPRELVDYLPDAGLVTDRETIRRFLAAIGQSGDFVDRRVAEESEEYVQPIPIAYFWHDGDLLVLRRTERDQSHRMHEKCTVWAGGHIRLDDGGEDPIQAALAREVEEELYLSELPELEVVGLVRDDSSPRSRMHVGIVHRAVLQGPIALAMDGQDFTEFRGGSVTVHLVGPDGIGGYANRMEPWSRTILEEHLRWPT
jgi:predicted NUDIX family phosphoesterase/thymidylate kinase